MGEAKLVLTIFDGCLPTLDTALVSSNCTTAALLLTTWLSAPIASLLLHSQIPLYGGHWLGNSCTISTENSTVSVLHLFSCSGGVEGSGWVTPCQTKGTRVVCQCPAPSTAWWWWSSNKIYTREMSFFFRLAESLNAYMVISYNLSAVLISGLVIYYCHCLELCWSQ